MLVSFETLRAEMRPFLVDPVNGRDHTKFEAGPSYRVRCSKVVITTQMICHNIVSTGNVIVSVIAAFLVCKYIDRKVGFFYTSKHLHLIIFDRHL